MECGVSATRARLGPRREAHRVLRGPTRESAVPWFRLAWIFSFLLPGFWPLAFLGTTVTLGLRFLFLLIGVVISLREWMRSGITNGVAVPLLLFGSLAVFSTTWSEYPELSFLKAGVAC